uniref:ZAD domain-containing protein n=1 Tax=Anopheles dirus TaxID=7168 RepID=A0A182N4T4_9DIPT
MAASKGDDPIEIANTNFSTCCRLCLSSSDVHSYYDIAHSSLGSEIDISTIEAIQMVINIEVALNEHLPSRICGLCYTRLDDAYCFIRDSVRNNDVFLNYHHSESMDSDSDAASNCNEICREEMRLEIASDPSELKNAEIQNKQQKGAKRGSTTTQNPKDKDQPNGLTAVDFVLQHVIHLRKHLVRMHPSSDMEKSLQAGITARDDLDDQ